MLAADVVLLIGLGFWPCKRSTLWGIGGLALFSFLGLLAVGLFSLIFRSNIGQCLLEGLLWHGGFFLILAGTILIIRRRRILGIFPILLGMTTAGIGFDALVFEPYALVCEHYVIESPKIKQPLRIVFVADIQTDRIGAYERDTFRTIMEQQPDLILLGGDFLQLWKDDPPAKMERLQEDFRRLFQEIPLTAPLGVYAVCGNTDPMVSEEEWLALFAGTGVTVYRFNKTIEHLGKKDDPATSAGPIDLTLLSYEDGFGGYKGKLPETGNYHVMIGHPPTFAVDELERIHIAPDLMLAGHTHGGQVAIPGFGAFFYVPRNNEKPIPRSWLSGMHEFTHGKRLLVTRGSGMERGWAPRMRFNCRPEISVIDLLPRADTTPRE